MANYLNIFLFVIVMVAIYFFLIKPNMKNWNNNGEDDNKGDRS